jgi:outer membrane receptor protein involved in Fe transport
MKRIRAKKPVILLAAMMTASAGFAQDAGGGDLSLSDLLDIKLQTGSFLELDLAKSPVSMTIIDREKIELAGANSMSELLEIYVPGFQYMYNKWNGVIWGMRGVANDRNTKFIVLVNGHKLNTEGRDGFFSETSLGLFGEIERFEVLRGPAGLVYGSGAIAGVVNIVTREATKNGGEILAKGRTWTTGFGNTQKTLQGTVFGKIDDNQSFTGSLGWQQSDGVGMNTSELFGKPTWPSSSTPQVNGSPVNGSALQTPGDWKAHADWKYKNFRINGRFTHTVQEASGWFAQQPWPTYNGNPSNAYKSLTEQRNSIGAKIASGAGTASDSALLTIINYQLAQLAPVRINGKLVSADDPYWSGTADGGTNNRREYIADNVSLEATYDIAFGENTLKLRSGFDGLTSRMGVQALPGFDVRKNTDQTIEEFGERRYTLGALYLMKTIPKLQLAMGTEQRFDDLGKSMGGKNEQSGNPLRITIANIWYSNTALFSEGYYTLNDMFGFDAGVRWDGHTRTLEDGGTLNGKFAAIYTPVQGHNIKLIFQSSSNNGSADNYENGRYQVDDEGKVYTSPHFQTPTDPGGPNNALIPGVTAEELHALKPEKSYSFELTSNHDLGSGISVAPSISYNMIEDLFLWNQGLLRVVNAGGYNFMNFDLVANYKNEWIEVGANHTAQYVVNTNVEEQKQVFTANYDPADPGVLQADGTYGPTPGKTSTVTVNPVHDNITYDGEHFMSLNSNVSKLYVNVKPLSNVTLHSNVRVFWALDGRDSAIAYDVSKGYNYLNINTDPSIKWNASIHIQLPDNWSVGLYAYDILGINDAHDGGKFATHTLRWEQNFAPDANDLFAQDLQSFAMELKKSF